MIAEPLKENRSPLNRAALGALRRAHQKPDPESLYCLQLARWALDEGKVAGHGDSRLEAALGDLEGMPPADATLALELASDRQRYPLVQGFRKWKAETLAELILDRLEERLATELPGYPKPISPN